MGIFGMLIGVPIVAAIYRIVKNDVNKSADPAELALADEPLVDIPTVIEEIKPVEKAVKKQPTKPANKKKSKKSK